MAKPIEPTPVLSGEDAKEFRRLTQEEERKVNPKKAEFLQNCFNLYQKFKK